jgi:hypothetical protein
MAPALRMTRSIKEKATIFFIVILARGRENEEENSAPALL